MNNRKIIVVGDLHGDWGKLNQLISQKNPDIILQCGDFGWWPKLEIEEPVMYGRQRGWKLKGIKPHNTGVFWCDGNHEEHPTLIQDGSARQMYTNVYHMSRGSTLTLTDGRKILFIGGADSVDKDYRTPGHDWFPEELISQRELDRALSHETIDIVISHTTPLSFDVKGTIPKSTEWKSNDPCRVALEEILKKYKPSQWYFGHWHRYQTGLHKNTRWTCLDYPGHGGRWWEVLEDE